MRSFLPASTRVGFIGLGAMGAPMVRRLVRAGYRVNAFDLDPARIAAVVAHGAQAVAGPADLAGHSDLIGVSLPSSEVFVSVAEQALIPAAREGQVFIDFGTTVPAETRRLHAAFAARGAALLDVPVSGGAAGAESGRLRMFAGGETSAFAAARPLLESIGGGDKLTFCGPSGSGQIAKGVNQLKSALQTAAMLESLAFAVRAGVSAEIVAAAFGAGPAAEASAIVKLARAVAADPEAHFSVKFRELPYYLAEARTQGFALPLTEALHRFCAAGERMVSDDNRPAPSFWRELMIRPAPAEPQ